MVVKVAPKVLETYAGSYKFEHDGQIEKVYVVLKDSRLYGYSNDEALVELYPTSQNEFYRTSKDIGGFKLQFVNNKKGKVTKFLLQFAPQLSLMSIPFDKVE